MKITTTHDIPASPEKVWLTLVDLASWHQWNPHIIAAEGTPQVGESLKLTMVDPKGRRTSFKPKVVVSESNRELRWVGKLAGIPGLFTGEHSFELLETKDGTRLIHSEVFSGVLVRPFRSMLAHLPDTFHAVNQALGQRVGQGCSL